MVKYIDYLTCALSHITKASINAVRYNKTHFIIGERKTPREETPREETNLFHPENCGLLWQYSYSLEGGFWMEKAMEQRSVYFFMNAD